MGAGSRIWPRIRVPNLWVRDLDSQAPARVLTQQRDRPQRPGYWTADGRFLISSRDGDGDENTVLVRIDPRTGERKDLTPPQGVKAVWIGADREAPNELLVALNDRDPRYHDTYVIDVETGERRLLYQSTDDGRDVSILWIDGAWNPVIRSQLLPDGGSAHELRLPGESEWRTFLQFDFDDTITGSGPGGSAVMANGSTASSAPVTICRAWCVGAASSWRPAAAIALPKWCIGHRPVPSAWR